MADPIYILVASGQTVSGAFTLERPDLSLVVHVPSLVAANDVRPQFSATSGGPFVNLLRSDGSGAIFSVHSGAGPAYGLIEQPPFPWGRFTFSGSPGNVQTMTLYATKR